MIEHKSLTRVVTEGSAWMLFSTMSLKVIGILSIFVVLSNLSVYEYGVVELVLSVLPVFSLFLLPGLSPTIIADMGRAKAGGDYGLAKGILRTSALLYLGFAVVAWALMFLGSELVAAVYDEHFALFFKIVSFGLLLSPVRVLLSTFFAFSLRFREQSLISFLEEIFKLLCVLLFVAYWQMGIMGMLISIVLSQACALAALSPFGLLLYRRTFDLHVATPLSAFGLLRAHARWGIAGTYVGSVGQSVRTWIIKSILGTEAVGLFAVALGIYSHMLSLVPVASVVGPMLAQQIGDTRRLSLLISKSVKYQFMGFMLVAAGMSIILPALVTFLFPQYAQALPLVLILSVMLIPASLDTLFSHIFSAFQAQRNQFIASCYKVALTAVIFPPMLMWLGLPGACVGLILVTLLYDIERYRAVRKLLPSFRLDLGALFSYDEVDREFVGKIRSAVVR